MIYADGSMRRFADGKWTEQPAGSIRSMATGPGETRYFVGGNGGTELVMAAGDKRTTVDTGFPVAQVAADEGGGLWAVDTEGVPHAQTKDGWQALPGKVRQLAASKGQLWALGTTPAAGGYDILQWTGSEWKLVSPGAAGIQLSATEGLLWAVNGGGVVWNWDGKQWVPHSGTLHAVAAAPDGVVFALQYDAAKDDWQLMRLVNGAWAAAETR
jgi:hypothetical protein